MQQRMEVRYSAAFKQQVIAELESGRFGSITEARAHYQIGGACTIQRWLGRYQTRHDPTAFMDRPRSGRERLWEDEELEILDALLQEQSPQSLGYPASQWTVPLLCEHLAQCDLPRCSPNTLRRYLDEQDWVWKRPRYVLNPDPQTEKKTTHSRATPAQNGPPCRAFRG